MEQSFIESITIRLDTKNGEDELFEDSDIFTVVTLHLKRIPHFYMFQFVS